MFGKVVTENGQKKIIPLTADAGAGGPVGSYIYMEKKSAPAGYLYCDGSTFDQDAYPLLYAYLGSNVLPDKDTGRQSGDPYYYIKATSGLSEGQQDNVVAQLNEERSYSTEEVNTGKKWIDGKPIYRKVIDCGALPNNANKDVAFTFSGIDMIINIKAISSSSTSIITIPRASSTANQCVDIYAYKPSDIIRISTSMDYSGYTKTYITIEYTKSTD